MDQASVLVACMARPWPKSRNRTLLPVASSQNGPGFTEPTTEVTTVRGLEWASGDRSITVAAASWLICDLRYEGIHKVGSPYDLEIPDDARFALNARRALASTRAARRKKKLLILARVCVSIVFGSESSPKSVCAMNTRTAPDKERPRKICGSSTD
ncbi:hypothetical protein MRX96_036578 [Rhipicephalus microplus]